MSINYVCKLYYILYNEINFHKIKLLEKVSLIVQSLTYIYTNFHRNNHNSNTQVTQ